MEADEVNFCLKSIITTFQTVVTQEFGESRKKCELRGIRMNDFLLRACWSLLGHVEEAQVTHWGAAVVTAGGERPSAEKKDYRQM